MVKFLDKICEDCYYLYMEAEIRSSCRSDTRQGRVGRSVGRRDFRREGIQYREIDGG